ncbi:MAG TPA: hypothetical protein VFA72_21815 [Burkholderiales bacterium]|jgi:hypothetical protein|nr:hypothetical protein [Burkholderiales bacterium]
MRKLSIAIAALATLALVAVNDAWSAGSRAGRGFAGGGATRGGFAVRSPSPGFAAHRFHHHGRAVFFVGAPFLFWSWPYGYYYAPPPYYYGPDYVAREVMPPVYVEKFDGTPTPQTPGEIYCPAKQAYYPDVTDCPNGWQRIIREPGAEAPAQSG